MAIDGVTEQKGTLPFYSGMALRLSKALGRTPESWLTSRTTTICGKQNNGAISMKSRNWNCLVYSLVDREERNARRSYDVCGGVFA
jgi:hypothetical protein